MRSLTTGALLCCLLLLVNAGAEDDGRPVLDTPYGTLRGKSVVPKGIDRTVHAFYRVPFANPPVGHYRFAAPESAEPWSGVREAAEQPPMCLQNKEFMQNLLDAVGIKFELPPTSEDCLYLNVFTPADRPQNAKLPVMVFIHGGGLIMGGAMMFEGAALCASENVVVVSIQYRLGIMGFFSTGDARAPGNYGFLDQVEALRWVQENIESFGGDPDLVTIFGESAGGVSVSALVLSPLTKGLFHRAIAESGVAILPGLMASSAQEVTIYQQILANASGCEESALVECLKEMSEEEVLALTTALKFLPFPGAVDGIFLPKPPEEIMAEKESNPVPFITGVTEQEFGWLLPSALNVTGLREGMDREMVSATLKSNPMMAGLGDFIPLLIEEYIGDESDPAEIRNLFLDMCGDFVFVVPALKTAKYHRDSGHPVFFYEFRRRPGQFKDLKPEFVKADHGDELFFVIGGPFLPEEYLFSGSSSEEEQTLSKRVMRYWANFARSGDPNGPGLALWPAFDGDEGYLQLDLQQTAAHRLKADRYEFWTKTLPERIQRTAEEWQSEHSEL